MSDDFECPRCGGKDPGVKYGRVWIQINAVHPPGPGADNPSKGLCEPCSESLADWWNMEFDDDLDDLTEALADALDESPEEIERQAEELDLGPPWEGDLEVDDG